MTISRSSLKKWLVPFLLLWVLGIGIFQSWHQTLTSDEAIHTASAYLAMSHGGDNRFDPEHPFLFKYLTGLPFLVYHTNLPSDDQKLWNAAQPTFYDSWRESRTWSDQWVYESGNNPKVMQMLMRIPGVLVLVSLCWFVWWLVRKWYGEDMALWALLFTAFNPTLLAHGFTTNTDVPLAFTYLLTMWRLGEYGRAPSRRNAVWAGIAFAVAMLTKFSAIALVPAGFIWLIGVGVVRKVKWYKVVADAAIVLGIFVLLTWVIYFFHSPVYLLPGDLAKADSGVLQLYGKHVAHLDTLIRILPKLLPSAYVKGVIMTIGGGLSGRSTFILGHLYGAGVWFYFPVLFVLKNQLITVVLGVIALGFAGRRITKPKTWDTYTWVFTVVGGVFLLLALKSKLNIGIRHITPLMPIFSIILAATMLRIWAMFRKPWLIVLIVVATIAPILVQSGNLIGFGNILTGPPIDRSYYFVDSNLDWGQSTERIAAVLKQEFPHEPVYVYNTSSALKYYAPDNPQFSIENAGADGTGAILVNAVDLRGNLSRYNDFKPAFVVDNGYFLYRTGALVPR